MKKLIFWQNSLSIHQCALLRALAARNDCQVSLLVPEGVTIQRKAMGWEKTDFGHTRIIVGPSKRHVDKFIAKSHPDDIHIFSGLRGFPFVKRAMQKIMHKNHIVGIFSEAPDPRGLKGKIRYLIYKTQALRYKQRIDFILATGDTAMKWYQRCGYTSQQLFSFGYFISSHSSEQGTNSNVNDKPHIIYIGSLIQRKAVDTLINALAGINCTNWQLDIIGDGPELKTLKTKAKQKTIAKNIHFHGNITNEKVMTSLQTADLLVLPSHYDGWGAVVNEALMAGVPVICSDKCGSACLLDEEERGAVFKAGSVPCLQTILESWIQKGPLSLNKRRDICNWAKGTINGSTAGDYLCDIIQYIQDRTNKPEAPWLKEKHLKTDYETRSPPTLV